MEAIYGYMPRKKSDYGKGVQAGVSFAGGYLAGILCAIVSHPADVMVSKLNANRQPGEAFNAAMGRIYRDIGFTGLWTGLAIRIFMIGTLTSLREYLFEHGPFYCEILKPGQNGASTTASKFSWACPRPVDQAHHQSKSRVCKFNNRQKPRGNWGTHI